MFNLLLSIFFLFYLIGTGFAGQIDSATYFRLQVGMTEGEALTIAGEPDKEEILGGETEAGRDVIRQLLYIPGPQESDPHLTVITVQRGRVINIERTKIIK